MKDNRVVAVMLSVLMVGALAACSGKNGEKADSAATAGSSASASASTSASKENKTVNLLTYDAFALSKNAIAEFEKSSGYKLNIIKAGDGAELTNKLILTKDNPLGDVAYGMDNNTADSAVKADVFSDSGASIPASAKQYQIPGDASLAPIDHSDICLNYDIAWFKNKNMQPPASYEDLVKPDYKKLTVVEDPRNSTPGLAFLLGTIKHFGDADWSQYWQNLKKNEVKVAAGWSEAFDSDFTAGSNKTKNAAYPIMVSYSSSPAWAVNKDLTATTIGNVDSTCYRQVEYAAQLKGAKNPQGAKAFINFLLSKPGQEDLVANNYVYPTNDQVEIPKALSKFGPMVAQSVVIDAAEVAKNKEAWLRKWTEVLGG